MLTLNDFTSKATGKRIRYYGHLRTFADFTRVTELCIYTEGDMQAVHEHIQSSRQS